MAATLDSNERGFEFEVEMIAVCLRRGWTLAWVPISTIYAGGPSHVRPVAHLRHFVRATRAARRLHAGAGEPSRRGIVIRPSRGWRSSMRDRPRASGGGQRAGGSMADTTSTTSTSDPKEPRSDRPRRRTRSPARPPGR